MVLMEFFCSKRLKLFEVFGGEKRRVTQQESHDPDETNDVEDRKRKFGLAKGLW